MTVVDIVTKILLFFIVFYGAIMITSILTKKINNKKETSVKRDSKDKE